MSRQDQCELFDGSVDLNVFPRWNWMKKAIVVALDVDEMNGINKTNAAQEALAELNQHLAEGRHVINSFPMSGTSHKMHSVSVIILEKV